MNVLSLQKCREFSSRPTSHLCPIPRIPHMARQKPDQTWGSAGDSGVNQRWLHTTTKKTTTKKKSTHTLCMFTCNVGHSERLLALGPFGAVGVALLGPPWRRADASQVHLGGFEEGHHEGLFILRPTATDQPGHARVDALSCRGRQTEQRNRCWRHRSLDFSRTGWWMLVKIEKMCARLCAYV